MTFESQLKLGQFRNWVRSSIGLRCLKDGLLDYVSTKTEEQYETFVTYVKGRAKIDTFTCEKCELCNLLPHHALEKRPCNQKNVKSCNCKRQGGRRICPEGGACGIFYDCVIDEHSQKDPSWCNTSVELWSTNSFEFLKCYISTPGYKNKISLSQIDASGLLSICLNNMGLNAAFNNILDLLKKVKDYRNEILHSGDLKISNERLKEYLNDMKGILQHSELDENEAAQRELKQLQMLETDEIVITSQEGINMRKDALKAVIEREIELKLNLSDEYSSLSTDDDTTTVKTPLTNGDTSVVKATLTAEERDKIEKELAQLVCIENKHYRCIEASLQEVEKEMLRVKDTIRTHRSDLEEIKTGLLSQHNVLRSLSEEQQKQSKVLVETHTLLEDVCATGIETHSTAQATHKVVLQSSNDIKELTEQIRRMNAPNVVPELKLTVNISNTDKNGEKQLSQRLVEVGTSIVNMEKIPPEKKTQLRHCLKMALNEIEKDENEVTALKEECLAIYVRSKSLIAWADLCERCLAKEFTQTFRSVEREVRRLTGLKNVELDVVVYEEDFLKSVNAIVLGSTRSETIQENDNANTNREVEEVRTVQTSSGRRRYQICFTFESSSDSDESSTARRETSSNDNTVTADFLDGLDEDEDNETNEDEYDKDVIEMIEIDTRNTIMKESHMGQADIPNELVCKSCRKKFQASEELSDHLSEYSNISHRLSDERSKWTQRSPPRGVKLENFTLCERYSKKKACPYGDKCTRPHTDSELKEWNKRLESMRQLVLHIGENIEGLALGYSLHKLFKEEKQMKATRQELDFVFIQSLSDLNVHTITKRFKNKWTFKINSEYSLKSVCLTDQEASTYYSISNITDSTDNRDDCYERFQQKDEWKNPKYLLDRGVYKYTIKVAFQTEIYGSFYQNIIFDFGKPELLLKQVAVESAPVTSVDEVRDKFEKQCEGRWQEENVNVMEFFERTEEDDIGIKLMKQYPLKELLSEEFPDSLNRENYTTWMHMMLYAEEQAGLEEISRFNIKTYLILEDCLKPIDNPTSETLYAQDGELFARISLNDELSVDSKIGKMILRQTHMIWIAPVAAESGYAHSKMTVYEARIEHRERDFIDVELSRQCVQGLRLKCGLEIQVEIQFQLDRVVFCEMHRAVDNLHHLDFVFPPLLHTHDFQKTASVLERTFDNEGMGDLNQNQITAVVKSSCTLKKVTPPLLIVGPYGTGKTYTIAQAVKYIITQSMKSPQEPKSRVLISTSSNSEADAYIKDYMHQFVEAGISEARPLRIYYKYRWKQTVPKTVLAYCTLEENDGKKGTFRSPTKAEVSQHRVIVTTLHTAKLLTYLDLPEDFFTHIFIDEAAQSLECDLLIPISLAGAKTRIILAGDHMQISPDVCSKIAQQEQFQMSMLERLAEYYLMDSPFVVTLGDNYRSNKAIIDFTSALFYDSRLKAVKNPAPHKVYYPLTFFTARGKEIMPDLKIGYYNMSELYEVVDQVQQLCKHWPREWGRFDRKSICVVSTYTMQIWCIRAELRRRGIHHVPVEMVTNVQGKQFRVIIMSTVRTKHTCSVNTADNDDYDLGFLSNLKLLNTVITRAQSLVIAVGDPVALCLIGRCSKVWEYYLEICNDHGSFFGLTWKHFKSLLENTEVEETYRLNPLAKEFVPRTWIDSIRVPPNSPVSAVESVARPLSQENKFGDLKQPAVTHPLQSIAVPPCVDQAAVELITEQIPSIDNVQFGLPAPHANMNVVPSTTMTESSMFSIHSEINVEQALPLKTQQDTVFNRDPGYIRSQRYHGMNPDATLFKPGIAKISRTSIDLPPSPGSFKMNPEATEFIYEKTNIAQTSIDPLPSQGSDKGNSDATESMHGSTNIPPESIYCLPTWDKGSLPHLNYLNPCGGVNQLPSTVEGTSDASFEQHAVFPSEVENTAENPEIVHDLYGKDNNDSLIHLLGTQNDNKETKKDQLTTKTFETRADHYNIAFSDEITSLIESKSSATGHLLSKDKADLKRNDNPYRVETIREKESFQFDNADGFIMRRHRSNPTTRNEQSWYRKTDDARLESVGIKSYDETPSKNSSRTKQIGKKSGVIRYVPSFVKPDTGECSEDWIKSILNPSIDILNPNVNSPQYPRQAVRSGNIGIVKSAESLNKTDDQKVFREAEYTSPVPSKEKPEEDGFEKLSYAEIVKKRAEKNL
ncbi:uncharacterized protein LOC128222124 isoform X1 [Mya arenaria]|uniref:uncharacterized protein LOC128222124 isoform X1 n=2 Tax=Mya arenaria TaxID=6604 RepID=UPI0022E6F414|nr:uncharacterized protein LOC128222124 isoform X1 [Mya arenaria]XP_052786950.1 uncharacterized protein LOC128222124 isoform X1 [Mya arenaria]XP_052786951.1 uncharacterized protein LOC128222124 isoform X1 [Mya arenaria]